MIKSDPRTFVRGSVKTERKMKVFSRYFALAVLFLLICAFVSCTDTDEKGSETEKNLQSQNESEESENWGLGVFMPEN